MNARRAIERLWDHIVEEDCGFTTPCLVWTGAKMRNGYGTIWTGSESARRNSLVHRIAYVGREERRIPDELTVDHLCRNKLCCNPDHMELVTLEENGRRGWCVRYGVPA